jgi:hypothetical protein
MPAQNRPMINATASIILTHPYYKRLMAGVSFKTPLYQQVTVSCLQTPGAPRGGSIAARGRAHGALDSAKGYLALSKILKQSNK